jgi:hypothetical protein
MTLASPRPYVRSMDVPILKMTHRWECPACGRQHVTHETRPHTPMHECSRLNWAMAPFVAVTGRELAKHSARLRVVEREDYVGKEVVTTDGRGRPVMAVVTDHADGSNDCHIFAPLATGFPQA